MRALASLALLIPAILVGPTRAATVSPRDSRVWQAAQKSQAAQLQLLEQVVNIDSGTGDVEGGRKVSAIFSDRLKAIGMTVRSVSAEAPDLPDNLVATMGGSGKGRILMIGHLDTVFGPGTAAKRSFRTAGGRAFGPGVSDEKGGVVEGIYALQLLHDLGFKNYKEITFLVETSEERGSPGTRALIAQLVKNADVEFNLEPGDPPDVLTVWRKGSTTFHIDVKGRAAHAGVAPQDGRNAAVELIDQLRKADVFPKSGSGLTANLTVMSAGTRNNIIPEDASAQINVRFRDKADVERVEQTLRQNARNTVVPDTRVTISKDPAFPPLPESSATDALADRALAIYSGIGMRIGRGGNGGASESALAADAGVPALDGLGPIGGGFHSDVEYLELSSVTPRLYLLAKLLVDVGTNPPSRSGH